MALLPLVAARRASAAAPLTYGVAARRLRGRRHRRRLGEPAAARALDERDHRAARLRRLRGLRRPRARLSRNDLAERPRDVARRRVLGAGAGALQRHGPALDAALGGGAGAGALPDGGLRRHGAGQLALGQSSPRPGVRTRRCARRRGVHAGRRRGRASPAACRRGPRLDLDPLNRWIEPDARLDMRRAAGRSRS